MLETEEYLVALSRESKSLADAASAAGTSVPVPTCPGWSVADLLIHCITGDLWARRIVERRSIERSAPERPDDLPSGEALVQRFLEGADALVDAMKRTEPDTPVWTFSSADRTAQFWRRRRANETTIHRYDAQLAAGSPADIKASLAVDGIDEFFTVFVPRWGKDAVVPGKTLHFHCTDVEGEWVVAGGQDGVTVTNQHTKGDAAVRGSASELLLAVWRRMPMSELERFGDTELLDQFTETISV
jgi:uncharacterized protein (TIGR03083 family)